MYIDNTQLDTFESEQPFKIAERLVEQRKNYRDHIYSKRIVIVDPLVNQLHQFKNDPLLGIDYARNTFLKLNLI